MLKMRLPADPDRWSDPNARGDCLCLPGTAECKAMLAKFGLTGIEYKNNEAQFAPCAHASVKVPRMTHERNSKGSLKTDAERKTRRREIPDRSIPLARWSAQMASRLFHDYVIPGNFQQADAELAAIWTREMKDGHEWTPAMVKQYRKKHKLTWHERQDLETMDLIPTVIHKDFAHTGGIGILLARYLATIAPNEELAKMLGSEDISENSSDEEVAEYVAQELKKRADGYYEGGFAPLHIIITVFLLLGFVLSFIATGPKGLLRLLFWLLSAFGPFLLLALICLRMKGLPQALRSKKGGIILLAIFAAMFAIVPLLSTLLFVVYLLVGIALFFKSGGAITSAFGPTGKLRVRREDADGTVRTEEVDVYGDMDSAIRSKEDQLRSEGYDDIRHD